MDRLTKTEVRKEKREMACEWEVTRMFWMDGYTEEKVTYVRYFSNWRALFAPLRDTVLVGRSCHVYVLFTVTWADDGMDVVGPADREQDLTFPVWIYLCF